MYEDSIEINFDTELYGYKDIPDMLKNANVQEFRNLIVEEVQPPSLMKALPDAPPVPVEKVEEKPEDAEIDDIGLEDGDLALNDRTWLFGRHKDNAGEENWVIRWDTSTALRDSNDKQKLFEQRELMLGKTMMEFETKRLMLEKDRDGEGLSGQTLLDELKAKNAFIEEWGYKIHKKNGLLDFLRDMDGIEEIRDAKRGRDTKLPMMQEAKFRLAESVISDDQAAYLTKLKAELEQALHLETREEWEKLDLPKPYPPIHGKYGANLELVINESFRGSPASETLEEHQRKVHCALESLRFLFGNLKKRRLSLIPRDQVNVRTRYNPRANESRHVARSNISVGEKRSKVDRGEGVIKTTPGYEKNGGPKWSSTHSNGGGKDGSYAAKSSSSSRFHMSSSRRFSIARSEGHGSAAAGGITSIPRMSRQITSFKRNVSGAYITTPYKHRTSSTSIFRHSPPVKRVLRPSANDARHSTSGIHSTGGAGGSTPHPPKSTPSVLGMNNNDTGDGPKPKPHIIARPKIKAALKEGFAASRTSRASSNASSQQQQHPSPFRRRHVSPAVSRATTTLRRNSTSSSTPSGWTNGNGTGPTDGAPGGYPAGNSRNGSSTGSQPQRNGKNGSFVSSSGGTHGTRLVRFTPSKSKSRGPNMSFTRGIRSSKDEYGHGSHGTHSSRPTNTRHAEMAPPEPRVIRRGPGAVWNRSDEISEQRRRRSS